MTPLDPTPLPPVVLLPESPPAPSARRDDRRRQWLADASVGLALLLTLAVVFLLDRRTSGKDSLYGRKPVEGRFLFDPLHMSVAEMRQNPQRQEWIAAYGGNEQSEAAVQRGLDWLARHQAADGHWGPDCQRERPSGRCLPGDVCDGGGAEHRVALTGLALLAFQAGGHYDFNDAAWSECVRHGLDWLVAHQEQDGCLVDREHGAQACNMYEHGIAAFALADACEMAESMHREPNDRYRQATQKAIQFIQYAQKGDGGWRYTPDPAPPSDVSVTGWQVLAIKSALRANVAEVHPECMARMLRFIDECGKGAALGRTHYQPGHDLHTDAPTGVGMLVHEFIREEPGSAFVTAGANYLAAEAQSSFSQFKPRRKKLRAEGADFYTLYNCTLAMFQAGGQPWKRWNDVVRDSVIGRQCGEDEGCCRGSWDPTGAWGPQGGRIYTTALAVLTLEVYYRYKSDRAKVYPETPRGLSQFSSHENGTVPFSN